MDMIKDHIQKAADLAETCPEESYRARCFEVVLAHLITQQSGPADRTPAPSGVSATVSPDDRLAQLGLSADEWSKVFHHDGESWAVIANDLKETSKAGQQRKLALLLGAKDYVEGGGGFFPKSRLVEHCNRYGAYDAPNFAAVMRKTTKNWFLAKDGGWELTIPGRNEAAAVIKELAQ